MPSRCLNRVMLIGNLTRDPELRYTPGGMAVTSFGVATNRVWVTKQGERKEDAQFHRIVAWNKLAELCSQLLSKGRRVFVEGRIQYRDLTDQQGVRKQIAEIVIDDMVILDNKGSQSNESRDEAENMGSSSGTVAAEDDGKIEDIVIPDEIMDDNETEVKKEETTSVSEESGQTEEEMPF
ncbi:MAG: single-stranded DNA-binding protein [Patescibacteria group bacterium]|jgi:single-strand DNA-binding protein